MSPLADFAVALLDARCNCPPGLRTWNGSDPAPRFAVYRNNVVVSLIEALVDTYPVTRALVGDDVFRPMARDFVRSHPPTTPVMAHYGATFADFVQTYHAAASVPYLSDMARLEWAYVRAFHAADAPPMPLQHIAALVADDGRLAKVRCVLHPSLQVVSSDFAVASLWARHQGATAVGEVDPGKPESALVLRHDLTVEIRNLSPGAAEFFNHLLQGTTLAHATHTALARDPAFALQDCLALLIQTGAILALTDTEIEPP